MFVCIFTSHLLQVIREQWARPAIAFVSWSDNVSGHSIGPRSDISKIENLEGILMIRSAHNYPISQIFDTDSKVVYAIPPYQRAYDWKKAQWEVLFDDIQENDEGYFFGSIICINTARSVHGIQRLEVIDGQQRLTTISLLFAALYLSLKKIEKKLDEDQRAELHKLKRKLILKEGNNRFRITLQIQNNNNDDYRAILSHAGVTRHQLDAPRNAGNRRIFHAFRYFESRIEEMIAKGGLGEVISFLGKINQSCLVKVEVESSADAYTLFASLNTRGMPLTAIDLIKNKLLATTDESNVGAYFEIWRDLLEDIGDEYGIQERFFRHYYNAFKDSLNKPFRSGSKRKDPLGSVATKSNLIRIYEKLIGDKDTVEERLKDIRTAGSIYSLMLDRPDRLAEDERSGMEKRLLDLDKVQGTPSHLLMLYLLKNKDDLRIDDEHLQEIIKMLVSFFVRRNLTNIPPTRDLNRLLMSIIDKISSLSGKEVVETIRKDLLATCADDKFFRDKLEGAIYEENAGVTRFILCALEGSNKERNLWGRKGNVYVWTIEHIFPQGDKIPSEWVNMIADGDKQKAEEIQESHVHKLGNLTLSGYNGSLGNKSFIKKRDLTDKEGRPVGYNNGLQLNKKIVNKETWNAEEIEERTKELAGMTFELFKLDR